MLTTICSNDSQKKKVIVKPRNERTGKYIKP
jgi:hypothetical protein